MEEKVYPDNPVTTKKSSSKKTLFIVLGVLLVLCICCVIAFAGMLFVGGGLLNSEAEEMQNVLYEVCDAGDISSLVQANKWFSNDFQSANSQDDTAELLSDVFPSSYDCEDLHTDGFLDIILAGHNVSVVSANGKTTGQYSINNGNELVTFDMEKSGDTWVIDNID